MELAPKIIATVFIVGAIGSIIFQIYINYIASKKKVGTLDRDSYFVPRPPKPANYENLIWEASDGRKILVKDLTYSHIINILIKLDSSMFHSPWIAQSDLYRGLVKRKTELENNLNGKS